MLKQLSDPGAPCLLFFFNVYLFLREREHKWGRDRERDIHRISSRLQAVSAEPDVGLELTDLEIMTQAKIRSLTD